jgi:hypothetical protein
MSQRARLSGPVSSSAGYRPGRDPNRRGGGHRADRDRSGDQAIAYIVFALIVTLGVVICLLIGARLIGDAIGGSGG